MKTVEVKVSELEGAALDWATFCAAYPGIQPTIHVIESVTIERKPFIKPLTFPRSVSLSFSGAYGVEIDWAPSSGGEHMIPLMERFKVIVNYHNAPDKTPIATTLDSHPAYEAGETIPIAACRAIVAAKLGDTVQIPAELA